MLHLIFQSTFDRSLLDRLKSSDDVVFLENAIFCLIKGSVKSDELYKQPKRTINLYVLKCDLETRGVRRNELLFGVETIDYPELVKMTEKNRVIRTWS